MDNFGRMDVNNLDMAVSNHGSFGYDLTTGNAGLLYPRGTTRAVLFAGGLWIAGTVNGEVRAAVGEYSQEFAPGPMSGGSYLPDDIRFRNFRIDRSGAGFDDYRNYAVPQGAPLNALGDPLLFGDALIWSVFNDANPGFHTNDAGATAPLGVEVKQAVFAFNRSGALANAIFLTWDIANKGANSIHDAYVSVWGDPDLGGFTDDLVGCDTTRALGYCYNATNADGVYGTSPPAVGFVILRGPVVARGPGVTDTLGATAFAKYINGVDPTSVTETYNLLRGLHGDGTAIHEFDDPTRPPTRFMVSGDPVTGTGWLDANPADRRMQISMGPFDLPPGAAQRIVVAVVVGQGTNRLASISDLRAKVDLIRTLRFDPVEPVLAARAYPSPGYDAIRLRSGRPWWCAQVEPVERSFDVAAVDPATVVMRSAGTGDVEEIGSVAGKGARLDDADRNGVQEVALCFAGDDLRRLFRNVVRATALPVVIRGRLSSGTAFEAPLTVTVLPGSGPLDARVAPNPVRASEAALEFVTARAGRVRVSLFDMTGRLVARVWDETGIPAGRHRLPLELMDRAGTPAASGIYFYRLEADEGTANGRFVVVK
jgi:hypothetical protein